MLNYWQVLTDFAIIYLLLVLSSVTVLIMNEIRLQQTLNIKSRLWAVFDTCLENKFLIRAAAMVK